MINNIETYSSNSLRTWLLSMKQTLKNPVCEPIYENVQATIQQIKTELSNRVNKRK